MTSVLTAVNPYRVGPSPKPLSAAAAKKPTPSAGTQPDWIATELFGFQKEGVAWLKDRDRAMLCDEMGLGKTLEAITWASWPGKGRLPCLVVCPASLKLNWEREIDTALDLGGPKQGKLFQAAGVTVIHAQSNWPTKVPDWVVINYDILGEFPDYIKQAGFKSIMLDEAHNIKNKDAVRTELILDISKGIQHRLYITGTPMLNRPVELFSGLVYLGVMRQDGYRAFLDYYTASRDYMGRKVVTGGKHQEQLHEHLKSVMLRREKAEVMNDLPAKLQTQALVGITNAAEYQRASTNFIGWLRKVRGQGAVNAATKAQAIVQLNHLRQLAAIGKAQAVYDMLPECGGAEGKAIIFSNFKEPLVALNKLLSPNAILYTSDLNPGARQAAVDAFQMGPKCYFLATIAVGGVGITLTAADRVYFLDLPWSPGLKTQAEDRAHRIGQERPVTIINVLAKDTVDEKMTKVLAMKAIEISRIVEGKSAEEAGKVVEQSLVSSLSEMVMAAQGGPSAAHYEAGLIEVKQAEMLLEAEACDAAARWSPGSPCHIAYRDYLQSDKWERLREARLRQAGGICERCQKRKATVVHHVINPTRFEDDRLSNLQALCSPCHLALHHKIKYKLAAEAAQTQDREEPAMFQGNPQPATIPERDGHLWWQRLEQAVASINCPPCQAEGKRLLNGLHDVVNAKLGKPIQRPDDLRYLADLTVKAAAKAGQATVSQAMTISQPSPTPFSGAETGHRPGQPQPRQHLPLPSGEPVNAGGPALSLNVGVQAHSPLLQLLMGGAAQAAGAALASNLVARAMNGRLPAAPSLPAGSAVTEPPKSPRVYNPDVVQGDQAHVNVGTLLEEIDAILSQPQKLGLIDPATQRVIREGA